jgi:TP53 regulating kinase-like protein
LKQEIFREGAEAKLIKDTFEGEKVLIKHRIKKNYRNPFLDDFIRRTRTRGEAKLIREASLFVNTPRILKVDEVNSKIFLEFLNGVRLKDVLDEKKELCIVAGECIKKLHEAGIIHGDLTTSNIIYLEKGNEDIINKIQKKGPLFFIDFGLGYFSKNLEDQATDLVVFKKTFNATHSKIKNGWELVLKGYKPNNELVSRMNAVEKRGRYH